MSTVSELNAETYERQRKRAADFQQRLTELHLRFVNFDKEIATLDYKTKQNLEIKVCFCFALTVYSVVEGEVLNVYC